MEISSSLWIVSITLFTSVGVIGGLLVFLAPPADPSIVLFKRLRDAISRNLIRSAM